MPTAQPGLTGAPRLGVLAGGAVVTLLLQQVADQDAQQPHGAEDRDDGQHSRLRCCRLLLFLTHQRHPRPVGPRWSARRFGAAGSPSALGGAGGDTGSASERGLVGIKSRFFQEPRRRFGPRGSRSHSCHERRRSQLPHPPTGPPPPTPQILEGDTSCGVPRAIAGTSSFKHPRELG